MCFSRVSVSAEAIAKGDVILPRCGHAVHGYPCFLEMITHGAEGGAGSGYRGCCRYCHARLAYDKMQRSALRARLTKICGDALASIKSPLDVSGYCYHLVISAVDILGMTSARAPYELHEEMKLSLGMDVSGHVDMRIRRELGRHALSPHFEMDVGRHITRVSVGAGALAAANAVVKASVVAPLGGSCPPGEAGPTAAVVDRLLDVTQKRRAWISDASHPILFQAIVAYAGCEEVSRKLSKKDRRDDPLLGCPVRLQTQRGTLRGVVADVVHGVIPFVGFRYIVRYRDGSSETLSRQEVEELRPPAAAAASPRKRRSAAGVAVIATPAAPPTAARKKATAGRPKAAARKAVGAMVSRRIRPARTTIRKRRASSSSVGRRR